MRKWLVGLILACAPSPTVAQLVNPPVMNTSALATKAEVAAVQATIPTAGTGSPTAVVDQNSGVPGAAGVYAPFNHTHPSKARKDRVQTNTAGVVDVTFGVAFPAGVTPRCNAVAETASGVTDFINVQIDGTPTNTGMRIRVTRTQQTVASLLGLTILSIPTSVGVTWVHYLCLEP